MAAIAARVRRYLPGASTATPLTGLAGRAHGRVPLYRAAHGERRPAVPIHFFARARHVFGEVQALENLLDTARDDMGLIRMDERLPKRVRSKPGTSGAL